MITNENTLKEILEAMESPGNVPTSELAYLCAIAIRKIYDDIHPWAL